MLICAIIFMQENRNQKRENVVKSPEFQNIKAGKNTQPVENKKLPE